MAQEIDALKADKKRMQVAAMNGMRTFKPKKRDPNWYVYSELFLTGSTTAIERCKALGIDPDGFEIKQ